MANAGSRREHFEQPGGPDFSQFFRGGDGRSGGFSFSAGGGSLSDLLGGLGGFVNMGGMGERMRRPPAEVSAEVTLEEADAGTTRLVNLPGGRRLEVKIPAGIADGGKVHIAAGGDAGGEFNLVVSALPHPRLSATGGLAYHGGGSAAGRRAGGNGAGEDAAGSD